MLLDSQLTNHVIRQALNDIHQTLINAHLTTLSDARQKLYDIRQTLEDIHQTLHDIRRTLSYDTPKELRQEILKRVLGVKSMKSDKFKDCSMAS